MTRVFGRRQSSSPTRAAETERYYLASSWTLMRRKFFKHRLALIGGSVLLLFYFVGSLFAGFFSTHDTLRRFGDFSLASPQRVRLFHDVLAAKIAGATGLHTIVRHLLPGFMSFLIVHLTLAHPADLDGAGGGGAHDPIAYFMVILSIVGWTEAAAAPGRGLRAGGDRAPPGCTPSCAICCRGS